MIGCLSLLRTAVRYAPKFVAVFKHSMRRSEFILKTVSLVSQCRGKGVKSCRLASGCSGNVTMKTDTLAAMELVKQHNIPIERVSLSRGLALNRFEKDFFIYPEYSDPDAVDSVLQLASHLRRDIIKAASQEKSLAILWDKYHLSSYTVPKEYGGTNVSYKDLLTICEGLGQAWSLYTRFEQTHLAASLILQFGNDQQKTRYLPQIAAGTIRPALCFPGPEMDLNFESLGTIYVSADGTFKLTARQQHFLNASDADLLFVFAKQDENNSGCFLIERNSQNSDAINERIKTAVFGNVGLDVGSLDFKEIIVEPDSMLGNLEDGIKIARKGFYGQITFGAAVVGFIKALISGLSEYCNATLLHNARLAEKDALKHFVTKLALNTYVLESMCYYTGGLLDEELVVLVDVEEAVIQKCARRLLSEAVSLTVDVIGTNALASNINFNGMLKDIIAALMLSSTELDLDSLVSSRVITSYANTKAPRIKRWRTCDGRFYERVFGGIEKAICFQDPRLKHFIAEHAHPSLKEACCNLEHTMWRLESLLDLLLSKHGKEILSDYSVLSGIYKVVECNLGMVTVIARSSRSYSIGIRNGDLEISWAQFYCSEAANTSVAELRRLYDYFHYERLNPLMSKIGQSILDAGGYCIESPVTRNW